jgi:hypothetical protein
MAPRYVHRVFVKVPGAKRGVAVFDFVLGGFNANTTWPVALRHSQELFAVCQNFPEGSMFAIKEVKVS